MVKNKAAFTVVELLCVITIMAIAAVIAVPSITSYTEHYQKSQCKGRLDSIVSDVRSECVAKRIEYSGDLDVINSKVVSIVKNASENGDAAFTAKGENEFSLSCDGICPYRDSCDFSWEITREDAEQPEYADVAFTAECKEHKYSVSETFRVTFKSP